MKQAHLSFGSKRKEASSQPSTSGDSSSNDAVKVIEILEDSPEKAIRPPAKKARLSQETGNASSAAKVNKSPARTPVKKAANMTAAADKVKSPAKQTPVKQSPTKRTSVRPSPAKTPSKMTLVETPLARTRRRIASNQAEDNTPSKQTPTSVEVTPSHSKGSPAAGEKGKNSEERTPVTPASRLTPVKTPSRRIPVTTPSSGDPNTTPSSQSTDASPSSQTDETSLKRTPNRTPRRSKTEAAFLEFKRQKDRELRLKEKEEKIKLKEAEKEKREEERLRREQEKQEAKERKEKERLEKEKKREAERLEKERERDEKERLRKEKERKKEEERLEKEREREEKERLRKEKEEERRKKEEERRRELEEEEAKKQKLKQAFKSFFVVKTTPNKTGGGNGIEVGGPEDVGDAAKTGGDDVNRDPYSSSGLTNGIGAGGAAGYGVVGTTVGPTKFKPFQLKKDMELAPIVPPRAKARFDRKKFEETLSSFATRSCGTKDRSKTSAQEVKTGDAHGKEGDTTVADSHHEEEMLYVELLKKTNYRPLKMAKKRNCKQEDGDSDCTLVQPEASADEREPTVGGRMRAKLLQFKENYRPAYYGTWRKRCPQVTGRRPFNKFEDFDYSVDSDDEWEDVEGEVESLVGTDDEKDKEENGDDEYEEDEFFVPHGYLSESEEEELDDEPLDPEELKLRMAARQEEFTNDRKEGVQVKKVVTVCSIGPDGRNLEAEFQVLQQFKAVLMVASQECPLKPSWEQELDIINKGDRKHLEPKMLTDDALRVFCETAHGFQSGVRQLYEEFYKRWRSVSDLKVGLKSLKLTLTGTCKKSKGNRLVVNQDLVERFGLTELDSGSPNEGTPSFSAKLLPDEVLPDLIKVAHGTSNTNQVITEFLNQMNEKFCKAQVKRTLRSIAAFEHVQGCWLVKAEILKAHNLEELNKKIKTEEKPTREEKEAQKKDSKDAAEENVTAARNKDNASRNPLGQDSNSKDSTASDTKGKENIVKGSTPKIMSIKKFFNTSASPSSDSPSSSRPSASTVDVTPKVKKRVQLTTLSKVATLKLDTKPQPVLDPEEMIMITDDD